MADIQLLRNTNFANDGSGSATAFDGWLVVPNANLKLVQVVGTPAGGKLDRGNQLCGPDNYRPYPNAVVVATLDPTSLYFNWDSAQRPAIVRIQIGSVRYPKEATPATQPKILAEWRAPGTATANFSGVALQATVPADYDRVADDPVYVVYWCADGGSGINPSWTIKQPSLLQTNAGDAPEPPDAPTNLAASNIAETSITLSFSTVADVAGYHVYRDAVLVTAELLTATTFTDRDLVPGTSYAYTVRSVNTGGVESADSAALVVATDSESESGAGVTAQQVASFLGAGSDENLVALAEQTVPVITAMVHAYTRGNGFTSGTPNSELSAVITTASARLVANPEQAVSDVGTVSVRSSFQGFTLAELFVLNRYRVRAQ